MGTFWSPPSENPSCINDISQITQMHNVLCYPNKRFLTGKLLSLFCKTITQRNYCKKRRLLTILYNFKKLSKLGNTVKVSHMERDKARNTARWSNRSPSTATKWSQERQRILWKIRISVMTGLWNAENQFYLDQNKLISVNKASSINFQSIKYASRRVCVFLSD